MKSQFSKDGKIYFRGLNGIRAIAAFIVITFHIDQFLYLFNLKPIGYHQTGMAGFGVVLFFVLSGYLITYLLLSEREQFQKIDLVQFYIRRILRIWPIYYLIIILTIIYLISGIMQKPDDFSYSNVALYVFMLANFAIPNILTLAPLWSIGVEEQFYLFWPFVLNKFSNVLKSLCCVIFLYLVVKVGLRVFENGRLYSIANMSCFDSMAVGGIMAQWVFSKKPILRVFFHPIAQIVSWLFLFISVFYKPVHIFSVLDTELHSIFYAIIIVNVSVNENTIIKLENPVFNFLGRISYGMYVYHLMIIWILSILLKKIVIIHDSVQAYIMIYVLSMSAIVLVSYLSYRYFESYFLRRKSSFSKVLSTN